MRPRWSYPLTQLPSYDRKVLGKLEAENFIIIYIIYIIYIIIKIKLLYVSICWDSLRNYPLPSLPTHVRNVPVISG